MNFKNDSLKDSLRFFEILIYGFPKEFWRIFWDSDLWILKEFWKIFFLILKIFF